MIDINLAYIAPTGKSDEIVKLGFRLNKVLILIESHVNKIIKPIVNKISDDKVRIKCSEKDLIGVINSTLKLDYGTITSKHEGYLMLPNIIVLSYMMNYIQDLEYKYNVLCNFSNFHLLDLNSIVYAKYRIDSDELLMDNKFIKNHGDIDHFIDFYGYCESTKNLMITASILKFVH